MSWVDLIPFKGRNRSLAEGQNLLSQNDRFFVMDNHRAALWCWLRDVPSKNICFLHIDMHWDCLDSITEDIWRGLSKPVSEMTITEYLGYLHPNYDFELFRWDNYLPPYLQHHGARIERTYAACHGIGHAIPFDEEIAPHAILYSLENIFENHEDVNWIVNVDCDYFFTQQRKTQLFHDRVAADIGSLIGKLNRDGSLHCCTVALSPECCGGWPESEHIASTLLDSAGVPFRISD